MAIKKAIHTHDSISILLDKQPHGWSKKSFETEIVKTVIFLVGFAFIIGRIKEHVLANRGPKS